MGANPVIWTQYVAGMISSIGAFAFGAAFGWSSCGGFLLLEENEILKLEKHQVDWVISILNIGCIISSLLIGILLDKFGRKGAMLILVIPFTIGWLLIIFGGNYMTMLLGRLLLGVGGGLFLSCPQYSTEIADKKIRGTLGTFVQVQFTGGILFAYVVGAYCNIFWLSVICGVLPMIFGILFSFMPETPYYLLSQNQESKAIDALIWLRGPNYDCAKEVGEIKMQIESLQTQKSSVLQTFERRSTKRGLLITIGLVFFLQMSGINVVLFYMKEIFEAAGVGLSSDTSSIIMGVVQLLATAFASVVIDRSGRKILLLMSSFIMAICLTMLGSFYYLEDIDSDYIDQLWWLPLTSLSFYVLAFSIGLGPVPWLIVSEVFSHDVKAVAGSLTCSVGWILSFIITSNFNRIPLGIGPIFWIFAAITAFGVLFEICYVPETKGKSLAEIQHILSKK